MDGEKIFRIELTQSELNVLKSLINDYLWTLQSVMYSNKAKLKIIHTKFLTAHGD